MTAAASCTADSMDAPSLFQCKRKGIRKAGAQRSIQNGSPGELQLKGNARSCPVCAASHLCEHEVDVTRPLLPVSSTKQVPCCREHTACITALSRGESRGESRPPPGQGAACWAPLLWNQHRALNHTCSAALSYQHKRTFFFKGVPLVSFFLPG